MVSPLSSAPRAYSFRGNPESCDVLEMYAEVLSGHMSKSATHANSIRGELKSLENFQQSLSYRNLGQFCVSTL